MWKWAPSREHTSVTLLLSLIPLQCTPSRPFPIWNYILPPPILTWLPPSSPSHLLPNKWRKKQANIKPESVLEVMAAVMPRTTDPYSCTKLLISDYWRHHTVLTYYMYIFVVELVLPSCILLVVFYYSYLCGILHWKRMDYSYTSIPVFHFCVGNSSEVFLLFDSFQIQPKWFLGSFIPDHPLLTEGSWVSHCPLSSSSFAINHLASCITAGAQVTVCMPCTMTFLLHAFLLLRDGTQALQ